MVPRISSTASARRCPASTCWCRDSASLLDRGLWRPPVGVLAMTFTALGDHLAITLPGGTALFTTRRGGVSDGPFASLNLGIRTDDDPGRVGENRARVERLTGGRLAQAHPGHGTAVVEADPDARPPPHRQGTARPGRPPIPPTAGCPPVPPGPP